MGWAQFMPSSYRQYAKDGDGDGRADLFGGSMPDLFESVANYFVGYGWQKDQPVAVRAVHDPATMAFAPDDLLPNYSLAQLGEKGYRPRVSLGHEINGSLLTLDGAQANFARLALLPTERRVSGTWRCGSSGCAPTRCARTSTWRRVPRRSRSTSRCGPVESGLSPG